MINSVEIIINFDEIISGYVEIISGFVPLTLCCWTHTLFTMMQYHQWRLYQEQPVNVNAWFSSLYHRTGLDSQQSLMSPAAAAEFLLTPHNATLREICRLDCLASSTECVWSFQKMRYTIQGHCWDGRVDRPSLQDQVHACPVYRHHQTLSFPISSGLNKIYSHNVIISSTDKYRKHESNMLIRVLLIDE